jgi:hypothetical protein
MTRSQVESMTGFERCCQSRSGVFAAESGDRDALVGV